METWALRVTAIHAEATDTRTIFLHRADGRPLLYSAGQFLTLLFYRHERELRRSYSFCTTPDIDPVPAITVKRVPNGEISRHLLDHLQPGDTLTSLPPAGRFTLDTTSAELFFIAAGSGLVPVFSLVKQALLTSPASRVTLLTQQHDLTSTPFYDALNTLAARFGGNRFSWIQSFTIRDGRLNQQRLETFLSLPPITPATYFYLCGPPAFMRMVQFTLRTLGIPERHIKREHFTVEHRPPPPAVFDPTPRRVVVHTDLADREFTAAWPDSILQAGLRQDIPLPYSCRAGRCSSCVARLMHGRVRMTNNEVLTEKDLREGLVLTCVGYAETDITLSLELLAGETQRK